MRVIDDEVRREVKLQFLVWHKFKAAAHAIIRYGLNPKTTIAE
jgi:hypothetical protein